MIDEILDYLGESFYPMHEYPDQPIYTDRNKEAIKEALTAIYEIGLGVIGEDETTIDDYQTYPSVEQEKRNTLRASQRKAWAKACGVDK